MSHKLFLPSPTADEMLSRGFKEQIYDVFKFMPETVQCTIFSATMPLEVLEVRASLTILSAIIIRYLVYFNFSLINSCDSMTLTLLFFPVTFPLPA